MDEFNWVDEARAALPVVADVVYPTGEQLGYEDSNVLVHYIKGPFASEPEVVEFSTNKKGQYMASDTFAVDVADYR